MMRKCHDVFFIQGSGFRVQGSGFRVQGSGFRVQGSGFRVQGSGFRWRLRRKKGSQPRLAALSSPFQGKGLAWMLPPSFGRRCPEGAEVGGGKRYPRHTAFLSRGRCPEGADRVLAV